MIRSLLYVLANAPRFVGRAHERGADAIAASARASRALDFDGASCVHPAVVPILNAAFAPAPDALDRARRMVAAFEACGGGASSFKETMVDLPIVDRARRLLARA